MCEGVQSVSRPSDEHFFCPLDDLQSPAKQKFISVIIAKIRPVCKLFGAISSEEELAHFIG